MHGAVRSQDCYECFSIDQLATAIRWAARLCVLYGVGDLAEDITIEALMKLRDKWAGVANPIGYLHTTLRNAAADAAGFRGLGRGRPRPIDTPLDAGGLTLVDAADPERECMLGEVRRALAVAIERLPLKQRDAVVARHVLELTPAEAARVLGRSVGAVNTSLYRALAQLRRVLPPDLLDIPERIDPRPHPGGSDDR